MEIVGHGLRRHAVERDHVLAGVLEGGEGLGRVQVPDVRSQEHAAVDRQSHRALQMRTHGKDGRHRFGQEHGEGGEPPGAPGDAEGPRGHHPHAVVEVTRDGAVVDQQTVGDPVEACQGVPLVRADRLVGQVP
jgi:hypothetical protein